MGRAATENSHEFSKYSGHCVNGSYKTCFSGIENSVSKLHIGEAGMVHKNKAGFVFSDKLRSFGGIGKFNLAKGRFNKNSYKC